jgi:hypothetical protein
MSEPRGIRLLSPEQFASMPETARATRRAHWAGIIRGLQHEQDRRYHSAAHILALEVTCKESHCKAHALSGTGLCAQHLHKVRAA